MLLRALSQTLVKEHRFKFTVGAEIHLLVVEELVAKLFSWPDRFRVTVSDLPHSEPKTFYGADCYEVAAKAADFIAFGGQKAGTNKAIHSSQNLLADPRPALKILQCQESDSD